VATRTITKTSVDQASPGDRDSFIWDSALPGFGLKITPAGRKVYLFQYRLARPGEAAKTTARRYTIGPHGALTPEQARKRAKDLAALVTQGIDPRQQELEAKAEAERKQAEANEQERREKDLEFGRIADLWLDHYENEKGRRPASVRQARLVVDNHLRPALAGKPMPDIGRDELEPIIDSLPAGKKAMRRAVHVYAAVLWGWALRRRYAVANPLLEMEKPPAPEARDRSLEDGELLDVWTSADSLAAPFDAFIRLLVLTGQRRSEIAGMAWTELDRATATWTIPAARAKNRAAHIVPLSAAVVTEIDRLALKALGGEWPDKRPAWPESGLVLSTTGTTPISGISKAKASLDAAIHKARAKGGKEPLAHWRLHDLRRTMATGLQRLGVRFEVTEAVLNHISGARGGVAGVYQRHEWADEKRTALEAWAEHVGALGRKTRSNVVSIAEKRA
jgi:integrase